MKTNKNTSDLLKIFYKKLTNNIKNDPNFERVVSAIRNNPKDVEKYLFCVKNNIDEVKNIPIKGNQLLSTIFNFSTTNRGDKRGKGEILLSFLIEDSTLSNISDLIIFGEPYEVKAYNKIGDPIAFGVDNTFTLHKFGRKLVGFFDIIIDKAERDSEFMENFPFWFDTRNGGTFNGKHKVLKFAGMEITISDFFNIIREIQKLKGIIDHLYVNDISELEKDMSDFVKEFNNRNKKILLFIGENLYSTDAKYDSANVTQARIKMTIN